MKRKNLARKAKPRTKRKKNLEHKVTAASHVISKGKPPKIHLPETQRHFSKLPKVYPRLNRQTPSAKNRRKGEEENLSHGQHSPPKEGNPAAAPRLPAPRSPFRPNPTGSRDHPAPPRPAGPSAPGRRPERIQGGRGEEGGQRKKAGGREGGGNTGSAPPKPAASPGGAGRHRLPPPQVPPGLGGGKAALPCLLLPSPATLPSLFSHLVSPPVWFSPLY